MATSLLTVRKIETAAPKLKPYWLKDGGNLYLYITPAGGKLWRYRYRIGSTSQVFSIGKYPEVSLRAARQERDKARELVKQGIHPLVNKKALLSLQIERNGHTFESVARDWMKSNKSWSDTYAKQVKSYLERDIFPVLGELPITAISVLHIRPLILDLSERGISAAMAVRQWISQIFSYGAQQGLCEHDPAAMLKRLVRRPPIRHNPPLPWQEIAPFMRKLDDWSGYFTTKTALKLVALTFVRTVEIRRATWDQFSLEDATWSIPAENMKMRRPHLVPLSRQALELLKELHAVTGDGSLLSYPDNRVDLQLAHTKKDPSRAPYEHTKYVSSRRILMQDWADILEALTQGASLQQITEEFGPMSERRSAFLKVVEREY